MPSGSSVKLVKSPRQESNLVYELRGLACEIRHTPRTNTKTIQRPAEESNLVWQLRRLPCFRDTRRAQSQSKRPDLDLNQDHGLRRAGCDPLHYQDEINYCQSRRLDLHQHRPVYKTGASLFGHVGNKQDRVDSNPVERLWRPLALPGTHSCRGFRAEDRKPGVTMATATRRSSKPR